MPPTPPDRSKRIYYVVTWGIALGLLVGLVIRLVVHPTMYGRGLVRFYGTLSEREALRILREHGDRVPKEPHSTADIRALATVAQRYGPDEVAPVIQEALRTPLPVLMDFVVESEEGVYPMVPAGEAIDRMLLV